MKDGVQCVFSVVVSTIIYYYNECYSLIFFCPEVTEFIRDGGVLSMNWNRRLELEYWDFFLFFRE